MNIFLTGGSGFVGRHLIERLGQRPDITCTCIGRTSPGFALPQNIAWHTADLRDARPYVPRLEGADVVMHLAAVTGRAPRRLFFDINTDGTRRLVDASREAGVSRFLFVSSIAAGFTDTRHYHYAESKRAAEEIVLGSGLRTVIVRPTIILGRGSPLGARLRTLATGPRILVFGNGRARIHPIHVEDLVTILLRIVDEDRFHGEVLEVGGPEDIEMEEFLKRVRTAAGAPPGKVVHVPVRPVSGVLATLERVSTAIVPFTAGQLSSFTNDGVAKPAVPPLDRDIRLRDLDAMIREMVDRG